MGKIIGRVFAYHVQQPNSVMRCINDTFHMGVMESPLPMLIDACQIADSKILHHLISASFLTLARLLVQAEEEHRLTPVLDRCHMLVQQELNDPTLGVRQLANARLFS